MLFLKDFKVRLLDPEWSAFDMLVEVATKIGDDVSNNNNIPPPSVLAANCNKNCSPLKIKFKRSRTDQSTTLLECCGLDDDHDHFKKKQISNNITDSNSEATIVKPKTKRVSNLPSKAKLVLNTPDLPQKFKDQIESLGGSDPVLIIQKSLYPTDLKAGNNRLSIPLKQIKPEEFLKDSEIELLRAQGIIELPLIQPSLEVMDVVLRQWDMPKKNGTVNSCYVLRKTWTRVVKENKLQEGDTVQLWSFRVKKQGTDALRDDDDNMGLALALVKL